MLQIRKQVQESVDFIRQSWKGIPKVGIILGTGLGGVAEAIDQEAVIDYGQIPGFPVSTAEGHAGQLVCGKYNGMDVVAMEGRFHYYEGYSMQQITYPVRVMKALGAELLIVSNAAGGMNPNFRQGDIVIIDDHINLMGDNPLIGINDDELGPRWPDMNEPYSQELIAQALQISLEANIVAHRGVYVAVPGPNLETRAEYRFLRGTGADTVGMSTVPEVIVAVHAGMKVLGLSVITDNCLPDALKPTNIQEIINTANAAAPKLAHIVLEILKQEAKNR